MLNEPHPSTATAVKRMDSLGCVSGQLHKNLEFDAGEFKFFRKCAGNDKTSTVDMPASDRGFLIGVSLKAGHRRRIFSGRKCATHDFAPGSVYIRDFAEDYRAELQGGFDFLLVELSRAFIT